MSSAPFHTPTPDWVGDVVPYSHGGVLYLYYLHHRRAGDTSGTSWHLVTTTDLVRFVDHGEVLPHGGEDAEDLNCYTGSIVTDDDGLHHLFYTAQNPQRRTADGRPLQIVAHATSTDLLRWTKHPDHSFGAPDGLDPADFRDPFVHRPDPSQPWQMILAGRHAAGTERRRGTVARMVSADLVTWDQAAPLWDPRRFLTQECPEVFRMGEWWYLVYSEFTDAFVTRYRMSRSPEGPWHVPRYDSIDGRAFYAAKSALWNGRRIFGGWIATREGEIDDGAWQWAGTLSLLEAVQQKDGTLAFRLPPEALAVDTRPVAAGLPCAGPDSTFRHTGPSVLELASPTGYAATVGTGLLPSRVTVRMDLCLAPGSRAAGILLRTDAAGECGYVLRLEPHAGRLVLDRWPRRTTGTEQWQISGDVPHLLELERPADLTAPDHHLDLLVDDDLMVAVLDEKVVLSARLYDHRTGRLGVFADDASLTLMNLQITTA